jgi:hypothetical protein
MGLRCAALGLVTDIQPLFCGPGQLVHLQYSAAAQPGQQVLRRWGDVRLQPRQSART